MASQIYVNSVTLSDAAEWNKWDTAAYTALSGTAGTNTITATGPANLGLVATNPPLWFIPAVTNTGATTLAITPSGGAALTAKNVFANGAACIGGELVAGVPTALVYDGTQYQIIGLSRATGTHASTWTFDGTGGSTGSLTHTYKKIGPWVDLSIPLAQATTGTGSVQLALDTAIPAVIRPAAAQTCSTNAVRNNGAAVSGAGIIIVPTSGVLVFRRDNAAPAFTNAASGGLSAGVSIRYFVG